MSSKSSGQAEFGKSATKAEDNERQQGVRMSGISNARAAERVGERRTTQEE